MRTRFFYILFLAFLQLLILAQEPQPSYILDEVISSDETRKYLARDYILMSNGFQSEPNTSNYVLAEIDPYLVFPPEVGTTGGPPNNNNGGVVGSIDGEFSVSAYGTASYSIPLQFPGGTNGMAPGLSLNYSSQGGDGIMGKGWSLGGLSVISRYPNTVYYNENAQSVVFSNEDELVLDGMHLIKINDSEYRTENESFRKIVPVDEGFVVYHSNGSIYKYGSTQNSRQILQSNPQPIAWFLDEIIDVSNNYMSIEYNNETNYGFVCPKTVFYAGNLSTGATPYYRIDFSYEDNFNTPEIYFYNPPLGEAFSKVTKRLTSINCKYIPTQETISRYELAYDGLDMFNNKYLSSVKQFGFDGSFFNPTFFTWHLPVYNPTSYSNELFNENIDETSHLFESDFNQDGKDELIHLKINGNYKDEFYIHMNCGNGFFSQESDFYHEFYYPLMSFQTGDFNGDAIKDIFYVYQIGGQAVGNIMYIEYDKNTNSFTSTITPNVFVIPLSLYVDPEFILGDFSGDGIMDCGLLYREGGSFMKLHFYLSTINEPLSTIVTDGMGNPWYYPEKFFTADFDGEGKDEILVISTGESKVFELTSDNQQISRYDGLSAFANTNVEILTGDFNGDAKADVLLMNYDQQDNVRIYHSYGNGFMISQNQTISNILSGDYRAFVVDLNGDRKKDLSLLKILNGGSNPDQYIRIDYLAKPDGKSFMPGETLVLQEPHIGSANLNNLRYIWCEVHNSGLPDFVTMDIHSTKSCSYRTFCLLYTPNIPIITNIINGLGETIEIYYCQNDNTSSYSKGYEVEYPLCHINSGLNVVTGYDRETGNGGDTYYTSCEYVGAKYHRFGKGFLGFDEVTFNDHSDGTTTTTYYSCENPYYHVQTDAIKQWLSASSALINSRALSNFYHDFGDNRYFHYTDETITETYNLNNQLTDYYFQDIQYFFDANGIPERITSISKKELGTEWVNKYQEIDLLNLTSGDTWILSLEEKIKTIHTSYDESPIERLTEKEYYPETGQLKKTTIEPLETKKFHTNYIYDDYGNIEEIRTTAAGLADRVNNYIYSPDGRFLESESNALEHTIEYQYYPNTGNIKISTDVNNLDSEFYYDGFGRVVKNIGPDRVETHNVLRWSDSHPDACTNTSYYSWTNTSGQSEEVIFFDKYGNKLRGVTIGFDGSKIYKDQEYYYDNNKIGLIKRISNPYYSDENPYYQTFTYDDLRRKEIITSTDDVITTFSYGIKQVTTTVVDGNETRIKCNVLDAAGRLKESKDVTNNESVKNKYYSNGLLKETWVNDHEDTKIQYSYDKFGNLDELIDPNRGTIVNEYNAFGEMISETKSSGFITYFEYDQLGRIINRIEEDGMTNWTYDTQENGIGILHYVDCEFYDANDEITTSKEEYYYDELSRIIKVEKSINDEVLTQNNSYDVYSRVKSVTYPSGYELKNHYSNYGYLWKVTGDNPEVEWKADEVNSIGKIKDFSLGTDIQSSWTYRTDNFRVLSIQSGKTSANDLQNLAFDWQGMGNLHYRKDNNKNIQETFNYDDFDRLTHCYVNGNLQLHQDYDDIGNISSKNDVGTYEYDQNGAGPNAVTKITDPVSSFLDDEQLIHYTSFDKIVKIEQNNKVLNMAYGSSHSRIRQVIDHGDGNIVTKTYFGNTYEKIEFSDGRSKEIHYLSSPSGVFGILTIDNEGKKEINYILKDYLGNINVVLDDDGNVLEEVNFDAWGRLRNPNTWTYDNAPNNTMYDRGYTMHEHLFDFKLINMNGRVFDPVVARFLSPDPFMQDFGNTQNHNSYSYCLNNPLKYTDPSGYNFIDALETGIRMFLNSVSIPARLLSGGTEWLNDKINGTPGDPNGYFSVQYTIFGILPAPPPGYIALFDSWEGASYGSKGGFVSADGTFHSHDEMALEAWAHYESVRAAVEEGDNNNFDIGEVLDAYHWVKTPGMGYNIPQEKTLLDYSTQEEAYAKAYKLYEKDGHEYGVYHFQHRITKKDLWIVDKLSKHRDVDKVIWRGSVPDKYIKLGYSLKGTAHTHPVNGYRLASSDDFNAARELNIGYFDVISAGRTIYRYNLMNGSSNLRNLHSISPLSNTTPNNERLFVEDEVLYY